MDAEQIDQNNHTATAQKHSAKISKTNFHSHPHN
jgi:hypothetical protein